MTEVRMVDAPKVRDLARHVVKFADGTYLPLNLRYESRVKQQRFAHRWLTWSSAKTIADSAILNGTGARAVRLRDRMKPGSAKRPDLSALDLEYGQANDPCPFCGGMTVGRRGHIPLTRSDGKATRCQVGDVRALVKLLREAK